MVKCTDCGKMMTNKSLKYSHKNKCSANKSLDPEVKTKKEIVDKPNEVQNKPNEVHKRSIEIPPRSINIDSRIIRMQNRTKKIESLASQAF
jgi:DNA-directed RNA polymerase subunit M/transcription elongation factor TFIIS